MCIDLQAESKSTPLPMITTQGGERVDTQAPAMVTSMHRVIAAAQIHSPEPDDALTATELFTIDLVAFLLFISVAMLAGWGWQEYQNADLAGLMQALGSLATVY